LLRAPIEVSSLAMAHENSALFAMIVIVPESFELGRAIYRILERKLKG
jgi:hypothetical protein